MKIILASASERRIELLSRLIKDFKVIPSNFDEKRVEFNGDVSEYVMEISKAKAKAVSKSKDVTMDSENIVIGCDTVVSIDNVILGKPKDKQDAFRMIKMLSGNVHNVYTGITIINASSHAINCDYSCTKVKFSRLTDQEIEKYLYLGEYEDKAGAYGIQGYAGMFVEAIEGCFYNVVGLPLNKLNGMLGEMGINL